MQTIKTAAVVVLMLWVIVGVGMSLTTPPQELSPEIEEMLMSDDFAAAPMDSMLPPTLAEMGLTPPAAEPSNAPIDTVAMQDAADIATDAAADAGENSGGGYSVSLSDDSMAAADTATVTPNNLAQAGPRFSTRMDSSGYLATNATFELPDPANFDAGAADAVAGSSDAPADDETVVMQAGPTDAVDADAVAQVTAMSATPMPTTNLDNALRTADKLYLSDRRKEALATLSIFYGTPDLTGEQRSELLGRLDPLALEVIYSKEHLLERPYRVQRGETLMEIAERFEVPWELLANINEVRDPVTVLPGTDLKVVRGPFRAEVDLTTQELTLFLGDLYAGRFPVGIGSDPSPTIGTFTVQEKQRERTFFDPSGLPVAPGKVGNPYGNAWLDLGGQLCIHGSPSTTEPTTSGCISLAGDYANQLYAILATGSAVTIRR